MVVSKLLSEVGIEGKTTHGFRHFFTTTLIKHLVATCLMWRARDINQWKCWWSTMTKSERLRICHGIMVLFQAYNNLLGLFYT